MTDKTILDKQVRDKLNEIANCICENIKQSDFSKSDVGLYTGDWGILLFLAYYSRYNNHDKYKDSFNELLDVNLDRLGKTICRQTFCSGLSGIFYSIKHINNNFQIDIDIAQATSACENYLVKYMLYEMENGNYDFMHGSLGIALNILKNNEYDTTKLLVNLLDILQAKGIKENNTLKWSSKAPDSTNRIYNTALSHGISSIIIFLCRVFKAGIDSERVKLLITQSINYILSQEIDKDKYGSYFPSYSNDLGNSEISKSRIAWCYGDMGVAAAIWQAGVVLDNITWKNKAIEIYKFTTSRKDLKDNHVFDAGICHGTAGIAHIFRRMYIETSINDFKNANSYWINETIKMAKFDDAPAGYKAMDKDGWVISYSFLEGIAGIGLSLLSYLSDDLNDSNWDEILLLS